MELNIDKSDWIRVQLGDVSHEYSKRISNPADSNHDCFVGNSNIDQWDFRVKRWESTSSVTSAMKVFESNDYLLVRRSLYASDFRERAPRAHFSGICSGDILTIKENPDLLCDGFLIGVLNSSKLWKFVVSNASGSITRRIKWKDLRSYEFLLPPKQKQAEISQLLWGINELITKREKCVFETDKLISSLLDDHFRDNLHISVPLGDAGIWVSGGTPSKKNNKYWGGDTPWVSPKDMKKDIINTSIDKITNLAIDEGASLLPEQSLLVVSNQL
ncbi:restriction endonuclease subunit S [Leucothrix pacifica]|uniref:Type I restriction modification DNA specificity domain-containing protein n=1 Tax=Leucothrix pacifica TaxID=1247513 RepID=A0A317CNI0_9GAMM|nr:restriction endonuclease subunit S [Leucothrix pacifica]PWQ99033.1 hypothetical protein DKW60_06190 [Leucothrix pacifica]